MQVRSLKLWITLFVLSLWVPARAQSGDATVLPTEDSVIVTIKSLPSTINSSFSEYACLLQPDSTFLFTSLRNDAAEDVEHFFETNWYCYLYESKALPEGRFSAAKPLPRNINNPKDYKLC